MGPGFQTWSKSNFYQQTYHDDVLKQPVLEILSAQLSNLTKNTLLELQNVDNVPADVTLTTLYEQQQ
jgi:hypothetical protein